MNKTHKKDNEIMDLLKINIVSRIICDTNQGPLKLNLRKGESKYYFTLDATELDKETNKALMELLYPKIESDEDIRASVARAIKIGKIQEEMSRELSVPQTSKKRVIKKK